MSPAILHYFGNALLGISAGGSAIMGTGNRTGFGTEAWIAIIPAPSTALVFGMGLRGLACWNRAKRA